MFQCLFDTRVNYHLDIGGAAQATRTCVAARNVAEHRPGAKDSSACLQPAGGGPGLCLGNGGGPPGLVFCANCKNQLPARAVAKGEFGGGRAGVERPAHALELECGVAATAAPAGVD